jgi:acetylornithine deacetylase/succinyl-diaminopimelate desuccinylase-like protein
MSAETYLEHKRDDHLAELLDFLRIPSISALPDHAADVARAGDWVAERLRRAGLVNVETYETGGHPVVYADWLHAEGKPTVLIYGHFDTQPADPLELWDSPPFEPVVKDGRVYARGASDDKGNMLAPILAVEALLKSDGKLPVNLKLFFEGQEEIGSPQLPKWIADHRDLLACDVVLSSDGGQWSETEPALYLGFKGLAAVQVDVRGAKSDLHSGLYGGAVPNALHALVRILDSMRAPDGKIAVEGFYDDVVFTDEDRRQIAAVPFDEDAYKRSVGVDALFGEPGYSPLERLWARPTLELNGVWGGFQGEGVKTVLPNEAHAKITCRLVPNQEPTRIVELIQAHVRMHAPPGVTVSFTAPGGGSRPYLMAADHPANRAVGAVLTEMYGREPYFARMGGTLPIADLFLRELGANLISFAFGIEDENFHAPNEFFRLASFERAQKAYCQVLRALDTPLVRG